jgi:hypothetical protein
MAKGPNQDQSLYGLPDPLTRANFPPVVSRRSPLPSDTGFPLGQLWVNNVLGSAWILVQVQGGAATWQPIMGGGAGVQTINGFLPVANNFTYINTCGLNLGGGAGFFSAGVNVDTTRVQCIANIITVQSASAAAAPNANLSGVALFNSTQFTVDPTGFVSLAGGGLAVDQIGVDAATGPGVNPVDPDATGLITINGLAVAPQLIPVRSHSTALNQLRIEVQRAASSALTNATDQGLASFNSAHFSVDANGFVSLAGGGAPFDEINVDAFTAPGTNPVIPSGTGALTITGGQSAAATTANVIRSHSTAANSLTIEVQRSTTSALTDITLNGVCHFNSAQFTVDPSGFVSSIATGAITWNDIIGPIAAVVSNGYFMASASVVTLPLGALGDTIEVVDVFGGGVVVQAAGADVIRISNVISSAGGTATSTQAGDGLRLVFSAAAGAWICQPGAAGNWILA